VPRGNEYLRWPLVSVLDLEPVPTAAASAREHTRRVLAGWGLARDMIGDAEVLVSELTTNAFRATLALHELKLAAREPWPSCDSCHPGSPLPPDTPDSPPFPGSPQMPDEPSLLSEPEPPPIALRLLANPERLVIEAWDCHPALPAPRAAASAEEGNVDEGNYEEGGRGIDVIEAYSNRWGARRLSQNVKTVWCEVLMPGYHHHQE
jgi:anti-sigma regulatory factor (Ser/Thr protein kinase)